MRLLAVVAATFVLGPATAAPGPTADVLIPGKSYAPSRLSVLLGTTISWRNGDSTSHTVTADGGAFDSGYIAPGGVFARTFDKAGVYAFHCTIHRFMRGAISVYGLVLTGPPAPLVAGAEAVFTGLAPSGAATVSLERRDPKGVWQEVAQHRPRPDGSYAFSAKAAEPGLYRARAGGAVSPLAAVQVRPAVSASIRGRRLVVTTRPARPGARVAVQTYDREHFTFVTAELGRLDARGHAVLPLGFRPGTHARAVVRGRVGWSDGFSRTVLVRQP